MKALSLVKNLKMLLPLMVAAFLMTEAQAQKKVSAINDSLPLYRPAFNPVKKEPSASPAKAAKTENENDLIYSFTDSCFVYNKRISTAKGYRIIIYSGNVKEDAIKAKQKLYKINSELPVYLTYNQPTFKLKVGDFIYRNQAKYYLNKIRTVFKDALLVEEIVTLN